MKKSDIHRHASVNTQNSYHYCGKVHMHWDHEWFLLLKAAFTSLGSMANSKNVFCLDLSTKLLWNFFQWLNIFRQHPLQNKPIVCSSLWCVLLIKAAKNAFIFWLHATNYMIRIYPSMHVISVLHFCDVCK